MVHSSVHTINNHHRVHSSVHPKPFISLFLLPKMSGLPCRHGLMADMVRSSMLPWSHGWHCCMYVLDVTPLFISDVNTAILSDVTHSIQMLPICILQTLTQRVYQIYIQTLTHWIPRRSTQVPPTHSHPLPTSKINKSSIITLIKKLIVNKIGLTVYEIWCRLNQILFSPLVGSCLNFDAKKDQPMLNIGGGHLVDEGLENI